MAKYISDQLKKLFDVKNLSSAQFLKLFAGFRIDLNKAWRSSKTYRAFPKFKRAVIFLVRFRGSNRVVVTPLFRRPEFVYVEEPEVTIKPKKLLYSKKLVDKTGGIEDRNLAPKKRDAKSAVKPTTAEKRRDSYLSTLRQRAIEANKRLRRKKDFGVKERASRWGTAGRVFKTNKTSNKWGTGESSFRENKKVVRWGTAGNTYKSLRKNVRWGTSQRPLDLETNKNWGTERVKKTPKQIEQDTTLKEYEKFLVSFNADPFIKQLFSKYADKIVKFLISQLDR